jgi:hypothetical protein
MRPLVAHCHLGLGTLYGRMGTREQAQEHLVIATTRYREMAMRFWLEQAEVALRKATARAPGPQLRVSPGLQLTLLGGVPSHGRQFYSPALGLREDNLQRMPQSSATSSLEHLGRLPAGSRILHAGQHGAVTAAALCLGTSRGGP